MFVSESRIIESKANKLAITIEINQVSSITFMYATNLPSTMGSLVSLSTSDVLNGKYSISENIYSVKILVRVITMN